MQPVALIGPTASGKSAVAMAIAARLPVEIISIDSAQVYREMDIGTAKPTAADRALVPHHLIDIVDPTERYSAARFRADALQQIDAITGRGRLPLLVGGTMLYFKALTEGLATLPDADPAVRAEIDREAARDGWPALHAALARVDPETAARLKPHDAQRIQRALEVYRVSGRALADLLRAQNRPTAMQVRAIALVPSDRRVLHERIAHRFESMLAAGLVDEVAALRKKYALESSHPSMRTVGYRQAWAYLEGGIDRTALRETGIFATRQLAKRQLTWLRALAGPIAIDCLASDLEARVLDAIGA